MIYNSTEFTKTDKPFVGCNAPGDQQLQRLFQTGVINEKALITKKHPLKLKYSDLVKLKVKETITREAHKVEINAWELLSQIHKENPDVKIHLDSAESQKKIYNWKRKSLNDLGLLHCELPVQPINYITVTIPNQKKETEPLLKILNQVRDHFASQLEGETPVERASLAKKHIFDHYDDVWRPVLILKAHFHTDSGETYQIHIQSDQIEFDRGVQIFPSEQKNLTDKKLYQAVFNEATRIFHHADSWPLSIAKITNGDRPLTTGLEAQLLSDAQYASEEELVKALIKAFEPANPYSTFVLNALFTLSNCQHHFSLEKIFNLMRKEPHSVDDPLYTYLAEHPDKLSEAIPLIQVLALLSADLKKDNFYHTRYQEQLAIQWKRLLIPLNTISLEGITLEIFDALLPLFPLSKTENFYQGTNPLLKRLHFAFYKYPSSEGIFARLRSQDSPIIQLLKEAIAKKKYYQAATLLETLSTVELKQNLHIARETMQALTERSGRFLYEKLHSKAPKLKNPFPPLPQKKELPPRPTYSLSLRFQEILSRIKAGDLEAVKELPLKGMEESPRWQRQMEETVIHLAKKQHNLTDFIKELPHFFDKADLYTVFIKNLSDGIKYQATLSLGETIRLKICSQPLFDAYMHLLSGQISTNSKKAKKVANILLNNLNPVVRRTEASQLGVILPQLLLFKGDLSFTPKQEEYIARGVVAATTPQAKQACMAFLGAERLSQLLSVDEQQKLLLAIPHKISAIWTPLLQRIPKDFAYKLLRRCTCSSCIDSVVRLFIQMRKKDDAKQNKLIKILVEQKRGKDLNRIIQLSNPKHLKGLDTNVAKFLLETGFAYSTIKIFEINPLMFRELIPELQRSIQGTNEGVKRAIEKPLVALILKQKQPTINKFFLWTKKTWPIAHQSLIVGISLLLPQWDIHALTSDQNLTLLILLSHPNPLIYSTIFNTFAIQSLEKSPTPFLKIFIKAFGAMQQFDEAQQFYLVDTISHYFDKLMPALSLDHPDLPQLLSRLDAINLPECNLSAMLHLKKPLSKKLGPEVICKAYRRFYNKMLPVGDCVLMGNLLDQCTIPGIITQEQEATFWRTVCRIGLLNEVPEGERQLAWIEQLIKRLHLTSAPGYQKALILLILESLKERKDYNQFLNQMVRVTYKTATGLELQTIPNEITMDYLRTFYSQLPATNYKETLDLFQSSHEVFTEFVAVNFNTDLAVKLFELQSLFLGKLLADYQSMPQHAAQVGALIKLHLLGDIPCSYKNLYQRSLTFSSAFINLADEVGLLNDQVYREEAPSDAYFLKLYIFNRFDMHQVKVWNTEDPEVQKGLLDLILKLTSSKYPLPSSRAFDLYLDLKKCPDFIITEETEMEIMRRLLYSIAHFGHVVLRSKRETNAPSAHLDIAFKEDKVQSVPYDLNYLDLAIKEQVIEAIFFADQIHEYVDTFMKDEKMVIFQKSHLRSELFRFLHRLLIYSFEKSSQSGYTSAKSPLYRQALLNFLIKITDMDHYPDYFEYLNFLGATVKAVNKLSKEGVQGEYTINQQVPIATLFRKPKKTSKRLLLQRAEIFNEWFLSLASCDQEFAKVIYDKWVPKYAIFQGFAKAGELEAQAFAAVSV